MSFRIHWQPSEDGLLLLSEPYLLDLKENILPAGYRSCIRSPKLYFSHNLKTQQTTIITTDLNQLHSTMVHHLKQLSGTSIPLEEIIQLLLMCFIVIQECFAASAGGLDELANDPVYCGMPLFILVPVELTTSSRQETASRSLDGVTDHNTRVRSAENYAGTADMMRGDFIAFKHALASLEQYFQQIWSLLSLDPNISESLGALFTEQKNSCEATSHLLDNIVSRYDRYLNLVLDPHPHFIGWYIK